jgi:UMF1 family MFS transporter
MSSRLRWCIAGTGAWWGLFTLPTLYVLRDKPRPARQPVGLVVATKLAAHDAVETLFQVRRYTTLAVFLVAFLFFNDGVQTVISQSSTFALQEVHFTEGELVGVILMVQFLAVPGAILIGRLADAKGQKPTLVFCLLVWIGLLISAWFLESKAAYWCMAVGVALVLGGTQAVSRAMMGVLTPEEHAAKFFGFFNLSGKATSFMGTFAFGMVIAWTGSSRLAIVNLLIFFVIGLAVLGK